jgi:hypothetical protein
MPDMIVGGTGNGYRAKVDRENRLLTYATTESEISHESESNKRAYTWTHAYDYDANDTILWLKNTSSSYNLIINKVGISADTTTQFIIHFPEDTTPAGTLVTGVNTNRSSNNTADALCYGDETGNTRGDIEVQGFVTANTFALVPQDGSIVLGIGNEFAIDLVTAGTMGIVTIRGYYHEVL